MKKSIVMYGTGYSHIAKSVALATGLEMAQQKIGSFSDGSPKTQLLSTYNQYENCYIVTSSQSKTASGDVPFMATETYGLVELARNQGLRVVLFDLCLPYARSDREYFPQPDCKLIIEPLMSKLFINSIISSVDELYTFDVHSPQIVLLSSKIKDIPIFQYMVQTIIGNTSRDDLLLLNPDAGSGNRTKFLAEQLGIYQVVNATKIRKNGVLDSMHFGSSECFAGKTVLIVEDMIDTGNSILKAINEALELGAKKVIVSATHGLFNANSLERFKQLPDNVQIIVSNSVTPSRNLETSRIKIFDLEKIIIELILALEGNMSLNDIFAGKKNIL